MGDVTSTLACSITAKKLFIDVTHVEGGIRSGDLTMPEEINRIVTDSISDYLFTTSELANEILRKIGFKEEQIHFVFNTMIDTLYANIDKLRKPNGHIFDQLVSKEYYVLTLHRPANVDTDVVLKNMIQSILQGTNDCEIIFPVHPRTAKILSAIGIAHPRLHMVDSLPYLEFNYLVKNAKCVMTDSGGITEEASVMNVPSITLRDNTERPETSESGTKLLGVTNPDNLAPYFEKIEKGEWKQYKGIPLWDGKTSQRIIKEVIEIYQ